MTKEVSEMRIAIYEPEPMVCGPMSWANHLQAGIRQLGHECDVVTFTRSGKVAKRWGDHEDLSGTRWRKVPHDAVGKLRDAGEILNSYDGIILNDPRTVWQDRQAKEGAGYLVSDLPDYLVALSHAGKPFTFALHGSTYHVEELPYVEELMQLSGFTEKAVAHSPRSPERAKSLWDWVDFTIVELPYVPVKDVTAFGAGENDRLPVGITGRYTSIKGHHALAAAAAYDYLPPSLTVDLHGGCTTTRAPSLSLVTFEHLMTSARFGHRDGHVTKGVPWLVELVNGTTVRYRGGYIDGVQTTAEMQVHLDLTSYRFTSGAVEYSQLESIDAGCLQASVDSMWDEWFYGITLPGVETWPSDAVLARDPMKRDRYLKPIGRAVEVMLDSPMKSRHELIEHNRLVLRERYDPKRAAQAYLDALVK